MKLRGEIHETTEFVARTVAVDFKFAFIADFFESWKYSEKETNPIRAKIASIQMTVINSANVKPSVSIRILTSRSRIIRIVHG